MRGDVSTRPSTVIAELGEYEVLRYESTFTTRAALVKTLDILLPFDFQDWVDNPSIEYWMNEYISLRYEEYSARHKLVAELLQEAHIIQEDIMDVSNTLEYYRGFKKEGD